MSATVITSYQWISYSRLSSQWQTHQKFWPKKSHRNLRTVLECYVSYAVFKKSTFLFSCIAPIK